MIVLGIETSCDETGLAVYDSDKGLLSHVLHSQISLHAQYGGVVPELASRDHIRKIMPLLEQVLVQANISKNDLDGIAYTKGPGLIGALLVGASVARTLGYALNIPTIGVHHMESHLLAPMLEDEPPSFPFVALLVSGGHTQLVAVHELGQYELLGESLDDAAGEAFDKTAKLLELGYPGGPAISKLAEHGNADRFRFPRPMTDRPGLDFSFSGLKTFTLNTVLKHKVADQLDEQTKADIAWAFQDAVVDTLSIKCRRAMEQTAMQTLVVAGGVSANKHLREQLAKLANKLKINIYYPRLEFCTDNGAMVAYTGYCRLQKGQQDDLQIQAKARWPLTELNNE